MRGRVHELKTWPEPFAAILDGRKPFEVRWDDRDFRVGDHLLLKEYIPGHDPSYTGREIQREVTFVLTGGRFGLAVGLVVMGLKAEQPAKVQPRPYPHSMSRALKFQESIGVEGAALTIRTQGFGPADGTGHLVFSEGDLEFETDDETGKTYGIVNLANSELIALRDKLNEIFPTPATKAALNTAVGHLKHMSAWLGALNSGYSFEALAEDLPGLEALLAAQHDDLPLSTRTRAE